MRKKRYFSILLLGVLFLLLSSIPAADIQSRTGANASPVNSHSISDVRTDTRYFQDFESGWPPSGWAEYPYYGRTSWYRSSSGGIPGMDPPTPYYARIIGTHRYSGSGILESPSYDSTGVNHEFEIGGFFKDVGIDNGDVRVFLRDNEGIWNYVCDLNVIHWTYHRGNNWYDWSWEITEEKYKHNNFAIRFYAKNIEFAEIAGLDNLYVKTFYKYYGGAVASNTQMYQAYFIETTFTVPTESEADGAVSYLLSAFDSSLSYDQLGIQSKNGGWWVYAGWTTGTYPNEVYYVDMQAPYLTKGQEYRFTMAIVSGTLSFAIYQDTTLIYSYNKWTGGFYFRIEKFTQMGGYGLYGFTVYEEVNYFFADSFLVPPSLSFYDTKVDGEYFEDWDEEDPGAHVIISITIHRVYVYNY
ncbi:MAG: hypothetical protein ACFFER_07345 [Candidatus Thorarchaeota archaeon]